MTATDPRQEGATPVAFLPGHTAPPVVGQGKAPAGGAHTFVDDEPFGPYCGDCGLVRGNWRHGPVLHVAVHGTPAPQGSKRHVGRGIMVESSKRLLPWREAVKAAAWEQLQHIEPRPLFARRVPVEVDGAFYFTRPKAHLLSDGVHLRDSAPEYVTVKPDIDKVQRSTFDALVDVGVLAGDEQIVRVSLAMRYGDVAGADLVLRVAS